MTYLRTRSSKKIPGNPASRNGSMKLVRHLDHEDREADGAVHWKSMGPKLRHTFQERGGYTLPDSQWLEFIWKLVFSIARTPMTFHCTFEPFKGTLEE